MISAVTDVAHLLAESHLNQGNARSAGDAAVVGLLVEPTSEILTQDAIRAALADGDTAEAEHLRRQLRARRSVMDPDEDNE
jgi:hypothetical protein